MIPVILCGGSGTRLWPVSRTNYPKQFCEFFDQSFLQTTYNRLNNICPPWVVTLESMGSLTSKTIPITKDRMILEPLAKNTAPAIALLCYRLLKQSKENEIVGVFPADHLIFDDDEFLKSIVLAEKIAKNNNIVTIGIKPTSASTAFGYIEIDKKTTDSQDSLEAFHVKSFREKPEFKTAEQYIKAGNFFWNAGIFVFEVKTMIEALKRYMPELWSAISSSDEKSIEQVYANISAQSIDFGVMEKVDNMVCIPSSFGWSDVGSWDEVARIFEEAPSLKSQSKADVFSYDASSNFVYSVNHKLIGLVNVKELIVVDTPDSLLIAKKGDSQSVKNLLSEIKNSGAQNIEDSFFERRSWGSYEVLAGANDYKIKKVIIDPQKSISYQSHELRDESWVIVSGEGLLVLDDKEIIVKQNDLVKIKRKLKHKITNTSDKALVFIEVQTGDYFGEDDIQRYES